MQNRACNLSTKTKKFLSTKIFVDNAFVDNCRQKFNFFKTSFFKFLITFFVNLYVYNQYLKGFLKSSHSKVSKWRQKLAKMH